MVSCFLSGQSTSNRCGNDYYTESGYYSTETILETVVPDVALRDDELITIPVVVHIVWYDPSENIPNAQIESQIDALNADFRMLNADINIVPNEFASLASDINIEFCLATVDPNGNRTSGITRTKTPIDGIGDKFTGSGDDQKRRIHYTALDGRDAWDTKSYLNIWVGKSSFLGFGCQPGLCKEEEDGIVISPTAFGTTCLANAPYNLGRTTTHEVGHYLNLCHPWGCESNGGNCVKSDQVSDTPMQSIIYLNCPPYPLSSCESNDLTVNFMQYVDDACMAMFTQEQKVRMRSVFAENGPREGILSSTGCALITPVNKTLNDDAIVISPNPAKGCIHIDLNFDNSAEVAVRLFNTLGQEVYAINTNPQDFRSIDISSLSGGIYFFLFEQGSQFTTKKIIVDP